MKSDEGFCAFAATSLLKRLKALTKEFEGVRESGVHGDIEYVHRMRVASRRLRSAIPIFQDCFRKKRAKGWRKGMKAITRALGDARDLDVQIAFLEGYVAELDSHRLRRGPERLLLRLRQRRTKAQPPIVEALDGLEASGTVDEMKEELRALEGKGKLRDARYRTTGTCARAAEAIRSRMAVVLGYEPCVDQPENSEDLHAMRIANKRLRYVMEVFGPLYDDGLKEELDLIKSFHTQLGDIHDCDVWEEFLHTFLDEERRRTEEFFGHSRFFSRIEEGILALAENRRAYRRQRYQVFHELFHRTRDEGFWEKLSRRVGEPLETLSPGTGESGEGEVWDP